MPYPNEHAARIADPDGFIQDSFRSKTITDGVRIITGKKPGSDSMQVQAYRFDKDKFTAAEAKKWLKDNDVKYISFEAASDAKESLFSGDGVSKYRLIESKTEGLIIDVHVISPGWGSSGYYSESVLQKAVSDGVYPIGMHMHIDHPSRSEVDDQPARTLKGNSPLAAIFNESGRYDFNGWDGAGIYAKSKVLPSFIEDIRAMEGHIGISHYVSGISEIGEAEGKRGQIIKELLASPLNTVDFVTVPGRGGHYRTLGEALAESRKEQEEKMTDNKITLSEVKKDKELMEALRADIMKESDTEKLSEALKAEQTKTKELKESLDKANKDLVTQKGRTYALAKVAESKLPAASQVRVVESIALGNIPQKGDLDFDLNTVEFDKAIEAAVKAEQDYIDSLFKESGVSGVHDLGKPDGETDLKEAKKSLYEMHIRQGKSKQIAEALSGYKEA